MKYRNILERKRLEIQKKEARQEKLRKKHGISNEKQVIVERGIGLMHLWQIGKECVRAAAAGIFFLLACVGMIGLVYAEPRKALYEIWNSLCEELIVEFIQGCCK